nr:glyoxalase-like domain-containing protein [Tanacetum cinerariifolium]
MEHKQENNNNGDDLPLMSLNHVSRVCKSVKDSVEFYTKALGFVLIERPKALDFDGAWLFNYGIGIHLVRSKDKDKLLNNHELDPMDNHISFQCEDMEALERKLKELGIKYMKRTVGGKEDGKIDQLFFKDP